MQAPFFFAQGLAAQIGDAFARKAVDALPLQSVRRIDDALDGSRAIAILAIGNEALGKFQIIQDAAGIGPLLEGVIVLEKMIVAEGGVGNHQRLHGRGVFFHDVGNARIGIDDDLIGQALQALAIENFILGEVFAKRPMFVKQRHAG